MKTKKKRNLGYTIIELLIGLVVVGLIFGLGYTNFRDYSRRQAVIGAVRAVQADIRLAQEQSIAGKKPTGCTGDLIGYELNILSPTTYQINANCATSDAIVRTAILPNNITMNIPTTNPVLFKALAIGTNIVSGSKVIIGLTQANTNNYQSIVITHTGELSESTATVPPNATPTPSPGGIQTLGTYIVGCNTRIDFPAVNATQFQMLMTGGGGSDHFISFYGYGSNGASWRINWWNWIHVTNQSAGIGQGETRQTPTFSRASVNSQQFRVGCNDGETMQVVVTYTP